MAKLNPKGILVFLMENPWSLILRFLSCSVCT